MLALWWAKFSPASHSVPRAWLTSVIYQNLWQAGRRGSRQKEPFCLLRRHEITWWGVGITQMNKLRVGILILGKHLSLERELLLTHSPIVSPVLTASSHIHPLSSPPFCPFSCFFFFVPIWYGPLMCFHVSVNTYWVNNILQLCHRTGTRIDLGDVFFSITITFVLL